MLPAFLEVKPSTQAVTAHEKDLIEIKQELDLLRREVRRSDSIDRTGGRIMLDAQEALSRIQKYLKLGMPEEIIVDRLVEMGPPRKWILAEIRKMKDGSADAARPARK